MAAGTIKVAVLDDYQNIASTIFSSLEPKILVTIFFDTISTTSERGRKALIERLQPFEVISTMRERTPFPKEVVQALPSLKLLLTTGMKNSAIDMFACAQRGIIVAGAKGVGTSDENTPPTSIDSTLQHCWALILGIARNVARDNERVQKGLWQDTPATGLKGKTLSLLGFGNLGARVASVAVYAFGMKVLAWSNSLTQVIADEKAISSNLPKGIFHVAQSKEDLVREADVLTIHYVLSERSRNILGEQELSLMKPSAILINTSRGALVDEQALLKVLNHGSIRGAAIDVYDEEPLPLDSSWRCTNWGKEGRSEVLLSPHMGYVEEDVLRRWYEDTATNLQLWLEGKELPTRLN